MTISSGRLILGSLLAALLMSAATVVTAAEAPEPAKLSTVAPAADLVELVNGYVKDISSNLEDESAYADKARLVTRDAHTLTALALVLGNHDEDHPLKNSAAALMKASQALAATKDHAAAKAALEPVAAAAEGQGEPADLKWEKVAGMGQLMKQVTFINTRLGRSLRRFDRKAEEMARDGALLAAIAQVVTYDTHEVKDPANMDQWYALTGEMRDIAAALNQAAHAKDKAGTETAIARLKQNCEACHKVFRIEP